MVIRSWMETDTKKEIATISEHLPAIMLEHTLNLIEQMEGETIDLEYRRRTVHLLYRLITETGISFHCSSSANYDAAHEFCIYLDGWILEINSEDKNPEIGFITVKPISK